MAAMAQLDCGACGYLCRTYSEAIASGAEPRLTLCSPGGSETAKVVKQLVKEKPADGDGRGKRQRGQERKAASDERNARQRRRQNVRRQVYARKPVHGPRS